MVPLYVIGCGGNAKIVVDILIASGIPITGFLDDRFDGVRREIYRGVELVNVVSFNDSVDGNTIFGTSHIKLINSIGNNDAREYITNRLKEWAVKFNVRLEWPNCIHPRSYLAPTVNIGYGNIICQGAILNSDASIGNFNLVNTNAIIEHDCVIGDFNHIAPGTVLCGGITVGNGNLVGAGTTIIPGIKIGNYNVIGAQAAIVKNFENDQLIVGVPGKAL